MDVYKSNRFQQLNNMFVFESQKENAVISFLPAFPLPSRLQG